MRSRTISKIVDGKYEQLEEIPDTGNIEEMGRLGVSPSLLGGDTYYFAGKGTLADQFKGVESQLDYIVATARRKGYNPNRNDVYESSLARFPGDPEAFVPPSGGINHIKNIAEARDIDCEGAFTRKRTKREPASEKPTIDKRLYKKLARDMVSQDRRLATKSSREVKEAVYEKHAYKLGDS